MMRLISILLAFLVSIAPMNPRNPKLISSQTAQRLTRTIADTEIQEALNPVRPWYPEQRPDGPDTIRIGRVTSTEITAHDGTNTMGTGEVKFSGPNTTTPTAVQHANPAGSVGAVTVQNPTSSVYQQDDFVVVSQARTGLWYVLTGNRCVSCSTCTDDSPDRHSDNFNSTRDAIWTDYGAPTVSFTGSVLQITPKPIVSSGVYAELSPEGERFGGMEMEVKLSALGDVSGNMPTIQGGFTYGADSAGAGGALKFTASTSGYLLDGVTGGSGFSGTPTAGDVIKLVATRTDTGTYNKWRVDMYVNGTLHDSGTIAWGQTSLGAAAWCESKVWLGCHDSVGGTVNSSPQFDDFFARFTY